jgi:hypothetical protein
VARGSACECRVLKKGIASGEIREEFALAAFAGTNCSFSRVIRPPHRLGGVVRPVYSPAVGRRPPCGLPSDREVFVRCLCSACHAELIDAHEPVNLVPEHFTKEEASR